ncbi:MAG: DegT/DnrJ/EryC1/StrS family aminotransferase [Planctomycetota bacterium]
MVSTVTPDRPAILGGMPAVTLDGTEANRWPIITDEDVAAVTEVLRSGELSLHPVTQALEADYRSFLGVKHALACCNGTSAIFAALHAFGLRPGDEVLAPSATYWASVMPILWCGAVPIFCESEPQQLGLDPDDVERKITPRTRAMVVVHLWGMPSKMDRLLDIARRHNFKVFEDASHAHGAKWRERLCGTLGDAAVFSLQTNKLAPAGEGGILVTNDDAIHEHALCLGHFERILPLKTPARRFAGTGFGMKHRMSPLSAAVARVQLKHLSERNVRRNRNIEYLSQKLEKLGVHTFLPPPGAERVYFQFLVQNDSLRTGITTDKLVAALKAEGCDAIGPRYPLLHQQPVFTEDRFIDIARLRHLLRESLPTYRPDALPQTTAGNATLIQLPSFPSAERALLDQYAKAFEKVLAAAADISEQRIA